MSQQNEEAEQRADLLLREREEIARADEAIRRLRDRNAAVAPTAYLRVVGRLTIDAVANPDLSRLARNSRFTQARRLAQRAATPRHVD
jgi:hypothetical protein